jgi:acyl-CoA oxidase
MAKIVIDNKEHGIHAFLVQLRSLENHKIMPGLELGDIGRKFGFDTTDNAYVKFNKLRIPRINMLMRFAQVTEEGKFKRLASDVLMYAAMLLMRGTLCLYGTFFLTISSTIAIRYSAVRRQTNGTDG